MMRLSVLKLPFLSQQLHRYSFKGGEWHGRILLNICPRPQARTDLPPPPYSAVAVKRDDSRETKTLEGRQNQQRKTIFTFYEKARETQGFPGIQNWICRLFPMLFTSFPIKYNSKLDFLTFPNDVCKLPEKI